MLTFPWLLHTSKWRMIFLVSYSATKQRHRKETRGYGTVVFSKNVQGWRYGRAEFEFHRALFFDPCSSRFLSTILF